ncbi:MAG: HAD hydrolase-like protein [Bryobacterales bacterium]|nr:HAD hydrolase-like protein [Bryobacterales bacterium]
MEGGDRRVLRERQHLIIDADDTLWENNIYFERAFEEFCGFLNHSTLVPQEIRDVLDAIELANNHVNGYGSLNFGRNLQQCYRRLVEREIAPGDMDDVMSFATRILEQPVVLIEGVAETLRYLAARHHLVLFTKGSRQEQQDKINQSGLGAFFAHTAIVKEKDADAYRALAAEHRFDPRRSWMIGNSPKSDINPALAAGLNAVFVPHAHTWVLERQEIVHSGRGQLLQLEQFRDLSRHF